MVSKGKDLGEGSLSVADQVNKGLQHVTESIDVAKLNMEAGKKSLSRSDFATANTYLSHACSLLPAGAWKTHYTVSLDLHVMLAKSHYSIGNSDRACELAREVLREGRCNLDNVEAYYLLVIIHQAREGKSLCSIHGVFPLHLVRF